MENPHLLEGLKKFNEYIVIGIDLPIEGHFGNFNLTYVEMCIRLDHVNTQILSLFRDFYSFKKVVDGGYYGDPDNITIKLKLRTEEVVYWLRKTADQIISLLYILGYKEKNGVIPERILIDSIGTFIGGQKGVIENYDADINKHKKVLEIIQRVSNAYKHTFLNSDILSLVSEDYPLILALHQHNNIKSNQIDFHAHPLNDVLIEYDEFLETVNELLFKNYPKTKRPESLL
jgi:hypothetical protein